MCTGFLFFKKREKETKKMLVKKCECGGEVHYLNFENLAECVKCFKSFKKVNDEYQEISREEFVKLYKEELKKFK